VSESLADAEGFAVAEDVAGITSNVVSIARVTKSAGRTTPAGALGKSRTRLGLFIEFQTCGRAAL